MGKKNKQNGQNVQQNQKDDEQKKVEKAAGTPTEEAKKDENAKKEEKDAKPKNIEIGLKVYLHCQGCADKVFRCLKGFDGVEEIKIDIENNKVTVQGQKTNPIKVFDRVRKKYSHNVELLYPKPTPDDKNKKPPAEKKNNEPQVKILILKIFMHCEGCAHDIKKNIGRMEGVFTVEPDMSKSTVVIKGTFDPTKLVETITKRLGKHVEILKQELVKSEKDNKENSNSKEKEGNVVVHYPQQYSKYLYECHEIFGDENIRSCSIM